MKSIPKSWPLAALAGALLFLVLLAGAAGAADAEPQDEGPELTLDQVVQAALDNNPGVTASQEDVATAEAQLTQTKSAYYPQVGLQSGYQRQWYESSRQSLSQGVTNGGQFNNYNNGLTVSQYLYDFGQTSGRVEKSRQNVSVFQKGLVKTQAERVLRDLDIVHREDFEAVKEMARLAREENEALKARIAALEAKLAGGGAARS